MLHHDAAQQQVYYTLVLTHSCHAAKRDKQEAEGKAAHATSDLQKHQQESHTQMEQLHHASRQQLQEAKTSSDDKMENYCNSFRFALHGSHHQSLLLMHSWMHVVSKQHIQHEAEVCGWSIDIQPARCVLISQDSG